jgi:spermidine/putrescine transport system permease protein
MGMKKPVLLERKSSKSTIKLTLENVLAIPYQTILLLLILIPIGLMIIYSFQSRTASSTFTLVFTFENYLRFFNEPIFINLMLESLMLATIATLLTLSIGYPLAYLIARSSRQTQTLLILLITAPMWINMLLRTRALEQIFLTIAPNLLGTNIAIVIGMSYVFLPFMVLPIFTILSKIDESLFESASDLGANKLQTILKVVLPLSVSGVLSGVMMVFLPAATTLVVPRYLGNGRYLIGNLIENAMIQQGNFGYGSSIALVMALIIMIFLYLIKKVDVYQGAYDE